MLWRHLSDWMRQPVVKNANQMRCAVHITLPIWSRCVFFETLPEAVSTNRNLHSTDTSSPRDASNPGHTAKIASRNPWHRDTVTSPLLVQILKLLLGMETWRIFQNQMKLAVWKTAVEKHCVHLNLSMSLSKLIEPTMYWNYAHQFCCRSINAMRYLLLTSWFDMQDCRTRSNMLRCFFLHWNVVQTLGGSGLGWVIFTWSLYCSYMSGRHLGFHMPEVRHGHIVSSGWG